MNNEIEIKKLSSLIDFKNGKIFPKLFGEIPVYGGNGILGYTNKANYENIIIVGRVGAYCGSIHIEKNKCWVSDNAIAGLPKQKESNEYNYYLLKALALNKKQIGSSQPLLTQDILNNIEIPIHIDVKMRKKIVSVLSSLDSKIKINNRINTELESFLKILYDYWFVQFDFPDVNGKPYKSNGGKMVWNDRFKGKIPDGWHTGTFKDILDKIECGDRPEGGIIKIDKGVPSIGAENILGIGKYNFDQEKLIPNDYFSQMKNGVVKSGDVLMYKDGAGLGQVSIFKNGFPYEKSCINSHVFILRSNDKISQNYLYFWLDQDHIKKLIVRFGMKAAQPGINQKDVEQIPILIPDKNLIENFENTISLSIDKIFTNSKLNKILSDLIDWLLPGLMIGQVKVK